MYQYTGSYGTRPPLASAVGSGTFPCGDGFYMLSGGPVRLEGVIRMIGQPELLEQPEWATIEGRAQPERIDQFNQYLIPWMITHSKAEITEACIEHGVLGGPINTVADMLEDANIPPSWLLPGDRPPRDRAPRVPRLLGVAAPAGRADAAASPRPAARRAHRRGARRGRSRPSRGADGARPPAPPGGCRWRACASSTSPWCWPGRTRRCTSPSGAPRSSASRRCSTSPTPRAG